MKLLRLASAGAGLVCFLTIAFGQVADLSGTWIGTAVMMDGSEDTVMLVLKKDDKSYTGTISDTIGHLAPGTPVSNFSLEKNEVKFGFTIVGGSAITVTVTVEGDKMKGKWDDGQDEGGLIELTRKKV